MYQCPMSVLMRPSLDLEYLDHLSRVLAKFCALREHVLGHKLSCDLFDGEGCA